MKNTRRIGFGFLLALCLLIGRSVVQRLEKVQSDNPGSARLRNTIREESKTSLRSIRSNGKTRIDQEIAILLEAYEAQDMDLLKRRVQELLDRDQKLAFAVFSQLDYTFIHYDMKFPHRIVANFLRDNLADAESMELMSAYTQISSIVTSIMSVFFNEWFERDHVAQFDWLKENSTFEEPRVLLNFSETLGNSERGIEALNLIDDLPANDVRKEELYRTSLEYLSSQQPIQLAEYLNGLETLPEIAYRPIYNMSEKIVISLAEDNPVDAMNIVTEWIGLIDDQDIKLRYLSMIASHLNLKYPKEYTEWFANHRFSNDQEKGVFLEFFNEEVEFLQSAATDTAEQEKLRKIDRTSQF